jgi:beta-phosphoglucomutase
MPSATDVIETWLCSDQPAVVFDFNGTLSDDEHILFDTSVSCSVPISAGQ